ncbi:MAG: class I SAM-dependent methyltransferase [Pseudolysinimonas sp.]
MSGPATSFGAAAGEYDRARPEYPADAVRWFLPDGAQKVADAGAGTGKLSAVLAAAGHEVVAIDPDPQMLAALSARYPGIPTLIGTGESLPLDDASVDAVTFGQAWHWVDPAVASPEVARVLRAGGVLGLFWNLRDESVEWVHELSSIMHASNAETMIAEGGVVVTAPFGEPEHTTFDWSTNFEVDGLVDLAASRSYVISETPERRAEILDGVRALAERVADADGRVTMPYRTHVYRYPVAR